jgi:hypothetical protein
MLHLSPVFPAIAAAGMLGFATIDTLSWQGQGVTLLLDWLAGFSPEHRARILRHEAGHFLVAYLLQIPVTGYALNAWEALKQGQVAQGGVSFDWPAIAAELQRSALSTSAAETSGLDRYCTLWMAGIAAEQFIYGEATGGAEDREKLRLIMSRHPINERALKERWATLRARTLIENHQSAYEALIRAMEERAAIATCYETIRAHLPTAV